MINVESRLTGLDTGGLDGRDSEIGRAESADLPRFRCSGAIFERVYRSFVLAIALYSSLVRPWFLLCFSVVTNTCHYFLRVRSVVCKPHDEDGMT